MRRKSIFEERLDRLSKLQKPQSKKTGKYIDGCLILSILIVCTILYLVITNIKWILIGVIAWVIVIFARWIYIDWKEKNKEKFDDYEQIS